MDQVERAKRRLRHREERRLHRVLQLAPLVLVGIAMLLSAGVVRVMEVPNTTIPLRPKPTPVVRSQALLTPDTLPDLLGTLAVSFLDPAMGRAPEEFYQPAEPAPDVVPSSEGPYGDPLLEGASSGELPRSQPVVQAPQPSTVVLLGCGLVWLGSIRRFRATPRRT
jgi:hypothetical protein